MRSDYRPNGQGERTFVEQARRAQIISCAIDTLAEYGYPNTSLARIAERAGISKGVISYHFVGKEELLVQVVASVYEDGARYMTPRITSERTAPEMLATYLRSNIEYIRDHPAQIAAVTEVSLNLRDADGALWFLRDSSLADTALRGLQDILERGRQAGELGDFDTKTMAWSVRTVIDGVNIQRMVDGDFNFDTCIDELVALFERATRRQADSTAV